MIRFIAELPDTINNTYNAVCAYNGVAFLATAEPRMRSWDLLTLAQGASSTTATGGTPSGIAIVSIVSGASAIAMVVSSNANQYDFVHTVTGVRTQVTTNAVPTKYGFNNQQLATIPSQGLACITQVASGGVRLCNYNTSTVTSVTLSGMTNAAPSCVMTRNASSSNTFLVGTTDGNIKEITSSGTLLATVSLPSAPTTGVQQQIVTGLASYNNYVVAATERGMIYCLDWTTGLVTDTMIAGAGNTNLSLSNSVSGIFFTPSGQQGSSSGQTVTEVWFETGELVIQDTFVEESSFTSYAVAFDPIVNRLIRLTTVSTLKGRVFAVSPTNKVNVDTRIQQPLGTDIAGRIIRLRDVGVGTAAVELDTTITPALTPLISTEDHNYIEIALSTSPSGSWDVREFKA